MNAALCCSSLEWGMNSARTGWNRAQIGSIGVGWGEAGALVERGGDHSGAVFDPARDCAS
ncbi:MAG: hypothetical protein ACRDQ7_18810 [Haloechinothrix sp.]